MLNGIVGVIEFAAKTVALVIAFLFWAIIGFFIWARLVVISFVLFTAQVMLSPFSDDKGNTAARRFRAALRLWPEGFGTIVNTIRGVDTQSDEPRVSALDGDNERRTKGFWSSLLSFLWQSALALVFWAPLVLLAHFSGLITIGPLNSLEAGIERWVDESDTRAASAQVERADEPPRDTDAPTRSAEHDEPTAPAQRCLGDRAVQPVNPPERYVTRRDVNVRRGPGTEHQRLARLRGGQDLLVVGRSPTGQWSLVEIDGELRCFIRSDYLRRAR